MDNFHQVCSKSKDWKVLLAINLFLLKVALNTITLTLFILICDLNATIINELH